MFEYILQHDVHSIHDFTSKHYDVYIINVKICLFYPVFVVLCFIIYIYIFFKLNSVRSTQTLLLTRMCKI